MKKVFMFCLTLIMCVGLVGCGDNKTTLDKLNSFTKLDEDKMFTYSDNGNQFIIMYADGLYGNPQIFFVDDSDVSYIYVPKEDMFVLSGEYDTEDSVTLYYYVEDTMSSLDEDYERYDLSGCYSYDNCLDEITDYFNEEGYIEKADKFKEMLESVLKENDLTIEDIDVPYDELDK